jgi:hypothetical protein
MAKQEQKPKPANWPSKKESKPSGPGRDNVDPKTKKIQQPVKKK